MRFELRKVVPLFDFEKNLFILLGLERKGMKHGDGIYTEDVGMVSDTQRL